MSRRSPFPGMDPWLEAFWEGVHNRLANLACDQIQDQLGPGLIACLEERAYIVTPAAEGRQFLPDVHVYETPAGPAAPPPEVGPSPGGGPALLEPRLVRLPSLRVREAYIEIRDFHSGERLVTAVEFVSAENKRGRVGRRQYIRKQRDVTVGAGANLVEVDLLRAGRPVTLGARGGALPADARTPYHASVVRAGRDDVAELYPLPLRGPLGAIRVPLVPKADDIRLHLQPLIDDAYRKGRYAERIDYAARPTPPLPSDDAAWAEAQLTAWRSSPGPVRSGE